MIFSRVVTTRMRYDNTTSTTASWPEFRVQIFEQRLNNSKLTQHAGRCVSVLEIFRAHQPLFEGAKTSESWEQKKNKLAGNSGPDGANCQFLALITRDFLTAVGR
jgi:hypothetical protein